MIKQLDKKTGDLIEFYNSLEEVPTHFNKEAIEKCFIGEQGTHKGFKWVLEVEDEAQVDIDIKDYSNEDVNYYNEYIDKLPIYLNDGCRKVLVTSPDKLDTAIRLGYVYIGGKFNTILI